MSAFEITDKLAEAILASAQTGIYVVRDGRFQYVNPQFMEYTGYTEDELIGKYSLEIVHPDDREMVRAKAIRRLKGEESSPYEYRSVRKDGEVRWIMERVAPLHYHEERRAAVGSYMDITDKKLLEERIMRDNRRMASLIQIASAVSGLYDLDIILRIALSTSLSIVDSAIGGILLLDDEGQTLSYRATYGLSEAYASKMRLSVGAGIAGKVVETGEPMLLEDISTDPRAAKFDLITTEGLGAFVSVPVRAKRKVLGVLNVASRLPRVFKEEDVQILSSIGDQIGVAIEQAKLYEELRKGKD
ncbi:MAG: PAS domain S-box protein [Dehalococcoidia bacterium]